MGYVVRFLRDLATVMLAGPWEEDALKRRIRASLPPRSKTRWIAPLVKRVLNSYPATRLPPPYRGLVVYLDFLSRWPSMANILEEEEPLDINVAKALPVFVPGPGTPSTWNVPPIATTGELARWFSITPAQLDWLADVHGFERRHKHESLRHYRYRWIRTSAHKYRLIEDPKPLLKSIQRCLLHDVLDKVTPHDAAHAFRPGRSVATYAAPHVGQEAVLHMDLRNFFPSIGYRRIRSLFRWMGYPENTSQILAGLCTNRVPASVIERHPAAGDIDHREQVERIYGEIHLPQGAPTSPALANLVAYRLDCRLSGLAQKLGLNYTRYADDLVFSGGRNFRRELSRFRIFVCAIAINEGFDIRHRKTRVMTKGTRQKVAGVMLNKRLNTPRDEFDNLRAMLFNCIQHGPASQNHDNRAHYKEHLQGRIAYISMLNLARGEKLTRLFEQIAW